MNPGSQAPSSYTTDGVSEPHCMADLAPGTLVHVQSDGRPDAPYVGRIGLLHTSRQFAVIKSVGNQADSATTTQQFAIGLTAYGNHTEAIQQHAFPPLPLHHLAVLQNFSEQSPGIPEQ